ncbi:hypothetical protein [Enterovibrio calviensis]|uniref:hypothetical protein n=1 Tax=Enterovibrio calviensis TaxID=91359 RepID=UPI000687D2C9|nr:hypothetical protein [Enterovibrio calviensis]
MKRAWEQKELIHGDMTVILAPGIGGRVMDVIYKGRSLLFINEDLLGLTPSPETGELNRFPSRAAHIPFPLWGGEKTWLAPEDGWKNGVPDPMLDSAPYEFDSVSSLSAMMSSKANPDGLSLYRHVTLSQSVSNRFEIHHKLVNGGTRPLDAGLWSVMMLKKSAMLSFCHTAGVADVKTVFGNPMSCVSKNDTGGVVSCTKNNEFKVGVHPDSNKAYAFLPEEEAEETEYASEGILLCATIDRLFSAENYAHGHALEIYNSAHYPYCELEWHGPLNTLLPDESIEMSMIFDIRECSKSEFLNIFK